MRRPKTIKVKVNVPRPLPERTWRLNYGWGMSLVPFYGERVIRTGMRSREEAEEQARYALAGRGYKAAWIYELTQPPRVLSLKRPTPVKESPDV